MRLSELVQKLREIKSMGFVPSLRSGDTGIGYTFESLMGLGETNIAIPDIGGKVEIKTTRRNASSLITLFTFNKGVWKYPQSEILNTLGYYDQKDRIALKNTIFFGRSNQQDIELHVDENRNTVFLTNLELGVIAEWDLYVIVGKFYTKMSRLLFVLADTKRIDRKEHFHFNEAYILQDPDVRAFLDSFKRSIIGIDLRMHLKESGAVRNRGTAFRLREPDLINLYSTKQKLI